MSSVAAAPVAPVSRPVRYVVHAGDTLAGIAAAFGVAGGWPVVYAANRRAVGGDPDVIGAGLVLVVPGVVAPARYTVAAGDSLSGIAARFGVAGGWPVLYAANRHRIGADPDVISAGIVLAIPRPATASAAPGRTRPQHPARPAPRPSARPAPAQHLVPAVTAPGPRAGAGGMPGWLTTTLLAVGLLIAAAFVTEPVLVARRRRQQAPAPAAQPAMSGPPGGTPGPQPATCGPTPQPGTQPGTPPPGTPPGSPPPGSPRPAPARPGRGPGPGRAGSRRPAARRGPIVLADHDRLVVTRCQSDDTVYVLRPPGADPQAILRVASLVLPERRYGELAEQLGVPASWPME